MAERKLGACLNPPSRIVQAKVLHITLSLNIGTILIQY